VPSVSEVGFMKFSRINKTRRSLKVTVWVLAIAGLAIGCAQAPKMKEPHSHIAGHKHDAKLFGEKATKHAHSHGGKVHHDFSDAQKWSKMFDDPKRADWQKPGEVVQLMAIKPGMVVADVGAGTGYFLPPLNKAVGPKGRVIAIDVEKNLISHIEKRIMRQKLGSTTAQLSPKNDPKLKAKSVDQVLIVDTWHHIQGRAQYGKKLKKGLKPGGKVVIVDFSPDAKGPGPKKEHRLASDIVMKELQAAGFKAKLLKETLPHQYIVVGY